MYANVVVKSYGAGRNLSQIDFKYKLRKNKLALKLLFTFSVAGKTLLHSLAVCAF